MNQNSCQKISLNSKNMIKLNGTIKCIMHLSLTPTLSRVKAFSCTDKFEISGTYWETENIIISNILLTLYDIKKDHKQKNIKNNIEKKR